MAVLEGGVSGSLTDVGVAAQLGLHTINKPHAASVGHYRIARRLTPSGTTTAGNLWTFRNPTASGLVMAIMRCTLKVVQIAAPTAAIEDQFSLKVARAYTVADTTNSTSIALAANEGELRTSFGTSSAQLRETSAAGGASGGTKTTDTNPIARGGLWVSAAVAATGLQIAAPAFDYQPDVAAGEYPLTLAADEGFLVTNDNSLGTASGIILTLEVSWLESTLF